MATTSKRCSVCGTAFECSATSAQRCWCARLPAIMPLDVDQDCRCPPCLELAIRERVARFVATITPADAHVAAARLADSGAAEGAPVEGLDYEIDALGRLVFSKWYLLRRGHCCESGCRNCPYGFRA